MAILAASTAATEGWWFSSERRVLQDDNDVHGHHRTDEKVLAELPACWSIGT